MLIALLFQSTASLVMAGCDCASLIFSSSNDIPSSVCVDLKYLNWFTSPSTFPFIPILVDGIGLMLLPTIMLFSEFISMPYPAALSPFQRVVGAFLRRFPDARYRQQTASCTAAVIRWTPRCQSLLHNLVWEF